MLLVGQFTRQAELFAGPRQGRHKRRWSLGPLELTAHLGTEPRHTHTQRHRHRHACTHTHVTAKKSHEAQWLIMSIAKTQYTNEGWCQGCLWQNLFISRDLSLNRKLLKSWKLWSKKFQVQWTTQWYFKATPTFWLLFKLNIYERETKATFWKQVYLIVKIEPSFGTCSMLFWRIVLFLYDPNLFSLTDARHRNWTLFTSPQSWRRKQVRNYPKQRWHYVGILYRSLFLFLIMSVIFHTLLNLEIELNLTTDHRVL